MKGNELQIEQLELASKNDFVRGKGVVNILGQEKRYWGELKASVADLSRYSAIMQKPFVPQPLAGGLTVDWSGDGMAKAHSGAFHAQLKKFRLVSVTEPKAHPLNADVEATYSPGNIFFSKLLVWDNNTNLSAKVTVLRPRGSTSSPSCFNKAARSGWRGTRCCHSTSGARGKTPRGPRCWNSTAPANSTSPQKISTCMKPRCSAAASCR